MPDVEAGPSRAQRWRQVEALFEETLAQPASQRRAFLRQACVGDPELEESVARLLAADAAADGTIEAAVEHGTRLYGEAQSGALVGKRIGTYRLVRELGHGGMGVVYLAERADDQYEKRVALKLIWPGLGSAERVRRFRGERQILADLDHPGIAKLLDGGTTDDGMPFLVMEYMEGETIDRYCERHALPLEGRLRLFRAVCDAVAFAHQHLVIHRDLKPANILVTTAGDVKLLDFGIAKLLQDDRKNTAAPTAPLMTPQYASPEQVRRQRIGTSTDVYSLGVVLYELLTGQRPYDVSRTTPAELESVVCEQDPPSPSSTTRQAFPTGGGPVGWMRLRGDLDAIVGKAMRKERAARYGTVSALAADIDRYGADEPVRARKGTWTYRGRKFLRRHWVALGVGAAFVAMATTFTVRVVDERDKATQALTLLVDLYELSEPGGDQRRVADAADPDLVRRSNALIEAHASQPQIQAELLDATGRLYQELGLYDEARPRLERAISLRRRSGDRTALAQSLGSIADLFLATDDLDRAVALYEEALDLHRQELPADDPRLAESVNNLANALAERGDLAEAEPLYREALGRRVARHGERHEAVAESHNNLALVLWDLGDLAGTEEHLRRAHVTYRQTLGDDHTDYAMALGNLGNLMTEQGRFEEAEPMLRKTLEIDRRERGDDHSDVALDRDNLATLLRRAGRLEEAAEERREALRIRQRHFGEGHRDILAGFSNLATVLVDDGRLEEAEVLERRALAGWLAKTPLDALDVAYSRENLGAILRARGDLDASETELRSALESRLQRQGNEHVNVGRTRRNLGLTLFDQGRFTEAATELRHALAIQQEKYEEGDVRVALTRSHLAGVLTEHGQLDEANTLLSAALEVQRARYGDEHPVVGLTLARRGMVRAARGAFDLAMQDLDAAWRILSDLPAGLASQRAVTQLARAQLAVSMGRRDRAAPWAGEAATFFAQRLPVDNWQRVRAEALADQRGGGG